MKTAPIKLPRLTVVSIQTADFTTEVSSMADNPAADLGAMIEGRTDQEINDSVFYKIQVDDHVGYITMLLDIIGR